MSGKFKVVVHKRSEGNDTAPDKVMTMDEIIESAACDWDPKDPGVGKAIILPDGRELLNPIPMQPPVGYVAEPTMMELMQRMLRKELMQAKEDEEVDTVESMNEYPEDDEPNFLSHYELIVMEEEFPESPNLPEPGEPPKPEEAPSAPPPSET